MSNNNDLAPETKKAQALRQIDLMAGGKKAAEDLIAYLEQAIV